VCLSEAEYVEQIIRGGGITTQSHERIGSVLQALRFMSITLEEVLAKTVCLCTEGDACCCFIDCMHRSDSAKNCGAPQSIITTSGVGMEEMRAYILQPQLGSVREQLPWVADDCGVNSNLN
jgi:hypothetical protein